MRQNTYYVYYLLLKSHFVFQKVMQENIFRIFEDISNKYSLRLILHENILLNNKSPWIGVFFKNDKLQKLGIRIGFQANNKRELNDMIWRFTFLKPKTIVIT